MKNKSQVLLEDKPRRESERVKNENEEQRHKRLEEQCRCLKNETEEFSTVFTNSTPNDPQ